MITAIVLIKADPNRIVQCATAIAGMNGVGEVYSVSGEWDLVAIIRVKEFEAIAGLVTSDMASVQGVLRTQTLTAFRAYSRSDAEQAWNVGGQ